MRGGFKQGIEVKKKGYTFTFDAQKHRICCSMLFEGDLGDTLEWWRSNGEGERKSVFVGGRKRT